MAIQIFRRIFAAAAFVLALTIAPSLHAQGGGAGGAGVGRQMAAPAERAERQVAGLATALSLTPAQIARIRPILVKQIIDQQAAMAAARQAGDMAAARTQNQARAAKAEAQIEALLTPAQKPVYLRYVEESRYRGAGGRGGASAPPRRP